MKKLLVFFAFLFLALSLVFAAQGDSSLSGSGGALTGSGSGNGSGTTGSGTGDGVSPMGAAIQNQTQTREQVQQRVSEINAGVQQRQQEMLQEMAGKNAKEQKVYQNQNQVRLAVHALLAMENITGGLGPQVSSIAREFDNSVQSTIRSEEKIQTRSSFSRFFAGGDKKTGQELEAEVIRNQQRLQQLTQLRQQCNCTEEAKQMLQVQLQLMQTEQARLQTLAEKEQKSKGLLGWIWK